MARKVKMARLKSKAEKYIPMIHQQLWNICMSIRKSNPKKHKAMYKDLMKIEEEEKQKGKNGKNTKRNH